MSFQTSRHRRLNNYTTNSLENTAATFNNFFCRKHNKTDSIQQKHIQFLYVKRVTKHF